MKAAIQRTADPGQAPCHLCGDQKHLTADIWYPPNPERDPPATPGPPHAGRRFVRICYQCGYRIISAAVGAGAAVEAVADE